MIKTAPTLGRLLTMVIFALSCFGLLLFLWLSFGGTTPLKPKAYRFQAAFGEATQLGPEAAVRIAGVDVGKVRKLERDPRGNRTLATIELDRRYAPLPNDAKAILRAKTLLGETYVELTPGSKSAPKLREGERLPNTRVAGTVEFDEILTLFDQPTRRAFRNWQQDSGRALQGRSQDLNDAIGQVPVFLERGTDLLETLDTERGALRRLVKNTGVVFGALTEREDQLHNLVVNTREVFDETAQRNERIAELFEVLPTFLDESRATFRRTARFADDARPVVRLLRPPTRDLGPTVRDVRKLAPDLERAFVGVRRLIPVSKEGLPALSQSLRALKPFFGTTGNFLAELNPVLEDLEMHQYLVGEFFTNGAAGLADTLHTSTPGAIGHYLRAFGPSGVESAGIWPTRLASNRGDSYIKGTELALPQVSQLLIGPQWDCKGTNGQEGGPVESKTPGQSRAGCWVAPPSHFKGQLTKYPHIERDDYTNGPGTRPTQP